MAIKVLQRRNGMFKNCIRGLRGEFPADASRLMKDRIREGKLGSEKHFCYLGGAWTSENFNAIGGNIFGARAEFNPLIKYAKDVGKWYDDYFFNLSPQIVDAQGRPLE